MAYSSPQGRNESTWHPGPTLSSMNTQEKNIMFADGISSRLQYSSKQSGNKKKMQDMKYSANIDITKTHLHPQRNHHQ